MTRPLHPAKRVFDVAFILLTIPFVVPFSILTLCCIVIENTFRGRPFDPLFYSEERMTEGRPFAFHKFNIFKGEVIEHMRAGNVFVHTKDLERNGGITHVGWCLKQIYMDELPQLWCVLRGDMSVVGPRPVNREVFELLLSRGITDKLRIRAGLTGPFQSLKDDHTASANLLDRWYADYVENHAWYQIVGNDIRIIFRTILVVLRAKGL